MNDQFELQGKWRAVSWVLIAFLSVVEIANAQVPKPASESAPQKSSPAKNDPPKSKTASKTVNEELPLVTFFATPLPNVIETLAKQAGVKYTLASDAINYPPPNVTMRIEKASARQIFDALLKTYGLEYIPNSAGTGGAIQRQTASTGTNPEVPFKTAKQAAPNTEAVPLMTFDETLLSDAIRTLARQAGLNHIMPPPGTLHSPFDRVTIRFENVPAGEALDTLLNKHGLEFRLEQGQKIGRIQRR